MLELATGKPIFQGRDEIHQLETIYEIFGTPSLSAWPTMVELPWYELVRPKSTLPNRFREGFRGKYLTDAGLDLAEQLLAYDPAKRVSAADALKSRYFTEEEPGMEKPDLGEHGEWHEMDAKATRRKKREAAGESAGR